jgi:putrescine importer
MVLIQPTAAIPLLVIAQKISGGHAVTTILIAMPTMAIAAVSYWRVPALCASAGVSV